MDTVKLIKSVDINPPTMRVRYTPENLHKIELSYIVESFEVQGKYIAVWLIPYQVKFIQTKQLTINYLKKEILK